MDVCMYVCMYVIYVMASKNLYGYQSRDVANWFKIN